MIKNKKTLHRRIVFGLCVALTFNLLCLIIWGLGYLKPSIQKVYDDSKLLKNEIVSQEYNSLEELISILDENKINYSIINFNNELVKESEKEHTDLLFISDLITVGNEHYLVKGYFKHYSTGGETFFDFFKIQLILLVIILGVVYLFSNKTIVNPISKLIDDMKNYKYGRKPTRNKVNSDIDLIQNEFVNLTEALDKNDEEKNRIIASISHDIKTPLTSIIGYSDLIKNEKDLKTIKAMLHELSQYVAKPDQAITFFACFALIKNFLKEKDPMIFMTFAGIFVALVASYLTCYPVEVRLWLFVYPLVAYLAFYFIDSLDKSTTILAFTFVFCAIDKTAVICKGYSHRCHVPWWSDHCQCGFSL